MMKKYLFLLLVLLSIISCKDTPKLETCLQALEIVSVNELPNGTIEYVVIGEVSSLSKGAHDFELAVERTLNLPKRTVNGCLVFEENPPECFGTFIFDSRQPLDFSSIKLYEKAKLTLSRVKLDEIIPLSFQNQKNVQYLYLIKDIEPLGKG